jgi:hypothetical protein
MLKLEATLIARMAARMRRNGWSLDGGVDFIVWTPVRHATLIAPAATVEPARGEPVSFLDADDILPVGTAVVRRHVSRAAQAAEAAARDSKDTPLTRAWSSVPRKLPGS